MHRHALLVSKDIERTVSEETGYFSDKILWFSDVFLPRASLTKMRDIIST